MDIYSGYTDDGTDVRTWSDDNASKAQRFYIYRAYILVNTYTLTGRKLNANKTTLGRVKDYSDRVCLAFGIQPYDKGKGKGKTVSHHEWEKRKQMDGVFGFLQKAE